MARVTVTIKDCGSHTDTVIEVKRHFEEPKEEKFTLVDNKLIRLTDGMPKQYQEKKNNVETTKGDWLGHVAWVDTSDRAALPRTVTCNCHPHYGQLGPKLHTPTLCIYFDFLYYSKPRSGTLVCL
ncbi:Ubiquitin-like domain-containing protein [Caenorhabditis elegans]|uniref:Ubiquitin-like domain-containing protein n=1 Tax=Caenorhabditis elegans TaxID=6239 RepID=G2HK13_CAEEL|nr:Ubiquitin-like domain-containing protein [Caenorhabditis elegans]CCD31146.1 Ubiquitin-like domain-containing protein [Caenorhabditis elegans]|eukprot:NP_001251581.1 Uncharacterized protein CELE_Y53H1A.7 [Caenorhabditis elegans]